MSQLTPLSKLIPFSQVMPFVTAFALALPVLWMQSLRISPTANVQSDASEIALLRFAVNAPKLGFHNLASDLLWLRFVQYMGDVEARQQNGYRLANQFLQEITDIDPHFEKAYLMANLALANKNGRIDQAEQLLEKGAKHNFKSYQIWQYRGFLHFMYTGDYAQAAECFQQNAWLAVAAEGNRKQPWANYWWLLGKYLSTNRPTPWLLRKMWKEVYYSAPETDTDTRRLALQRLRTLGVLYRKGNFYEMTPAPPPTGFFREYVYGPPSPSAVQAR